jgi:hypothetical protein
MPDSCYPDYRDKRSSETLVSQEPHGVTSQKATFFKTSNLTFAILMPYLLNNSAAASGTCLKYKFCADERCYRIVKSMGFGSLGVQKYSRCRCRAEDIAPESSQLRRVQQSRIIGRYFDPGILESIGGCMEGNRPG